MEFKKQEILDFFEKKIVISSINTIDQKANFPLIFFGKKVLNSNIETVKDVITSLTFTIDEKDNLNLLKDIFDVYQNPKFALEANLFGNHHIDEEGILEFGTVSNKDFVFDKNKLEEYIYFIWDTGRFLLHYYKPNTFMNDDNNIRIEIYTK